MVGEHLAGSSRRVDREHSRSSTDNPFAYDHVSPRLIKSSLLFSSSFFFYLSVSARTSLQTVSRSSSISPESFAPTDTYRRFAAYSVWHVRLLSRVYCLAILPYISFFNPLSPSCPLSLSLSFSVRDHSEKRIWMRRTERCGASTRTWILRPSALTSWTPSCTVSSSTQPTTSSRSVVLRIFLHAKMLHGIDVHALDPNVSGGCQGRGGEFYDRSNNVYVGHFSATIVYFLCYACRSVYRWTW